MSESTAGGGTHAPLPYVVKVRVSVSDDSAGAVVEYAMYAYSVMEAIIQGMAQASGTVDMNSVMRVESVEPDLKKFYADARMLALVAAVQSEKE